MKDPVKLKDLILQSVDFLQVPSQYKAQFVFDPRRADQAQLHCPFHGVDRKPSARYYKATQSMFCWKCHKSWNVISFIMEKENFGFGEALRYITSRYGVDISLIPDEPEIKTERKTTSETSVKLIAIESTLRSLRGGLEFEKYRALCAALTMARYSDSCDKDVSGMLVKIEDKLQKVQKV